ncbi:hypothetical protein, partial [Ensifer soli]|uniref:hypothetical protein n=1 Tax=Ciceribacter sp. sgz301302 TaxID=3342379 RepID=UPI0035B98612
TRTSESDKPDRVNHQSDSAFIEDALEHAREHRFTEWCPFPFVFAAFPAEGCGRIAPPAIVRKKSPARGSPGFPL